MQGRLQQDPTTHLHGTRYISIERYTEAVLKFLRIENSKVGKVKEGTPVRE